MVTREYDGTTWYFPHAEDAEAEPMSEAEKITWIGKHSYLRTGPAMHILHAPRAGKYNIGLNCWRSSHPRRDE